MLGKREAACRQLLHRGKLRARRADAPLNADEEFVGLNCRAIEARDPVLLMKFLQTVNARQVSRRLSSVYRQNGPRSGSLLLQVNGRYVIALVLDGAILCIVPVGVQAALESEST